jgi:hypothetical protein
LKAVVKAILLDPEARRGDDPATAQADDGHLKEPLLFIMNLLRAMNATSEGDCLAEYATAMKQNPFTPPSVFNFFHPTNVIQGTNLLGPEFEIFDSGTAINRINFVNTIVNGTPCGSTRLDFTPYAALAADPAQLVDNISALMLHGRMSDDMRNAVLTAITPQTDPTRRAKAALYLVGSSSQFQVHH